MFAAMAGFGLVSILAAVDWTGFRRRVAGWMRHANWMLKHG
jgi:hypothetical protein